MLETVLGDGAGGRLSITRRAPLARARAWPPRAGAPDRHALRPGPVEVEVEVIPAGAWGPAREVAAFEGGLVVDGLAVRTGFPLRFEPLGRDAPRWRGIRLARGRGRRRGHPRTPDRDAATPVGWSRPSGPPPTPRRPGGAGWPRSSTTAPTGRGGAQPAGRPLADRPGRRTRGAGTTSLPRRTGSERGRDDRWVRLQRHSRGRGHLGRRRLPRGRRSGRGLAPANGVRTLPSLADRPRRRRPARPGARGARPGRLAAVRSPVVVGRPPGWSDLDLYGDVVARLRGQHQRSGRRPAAWPAVGGLAGAGRGRRLGG